MLLNSATSVEPWICAAYMSELRRQLLDRALMTNGLLAERMTTELKPILVRVVLYFLGDLPGWKDGLLSGCRFEIVIRSFLKFFLGLAAGLSDHGQLLELQTHR